MRRRRHATMPEFTRLQRRVTLVADFFYYMINSGTGVTFGDR